MPVPNTRWYAWIRLMPPQPDTFHVVGEVEVDNPGIQGELVYRRPQGTNPQVLCLDLTLAQQPGNWARDSTTVPASYETKLTAQSIRHSHIEIFFEDNPIGTFPVHTAS